MSKVIYTIQNPNNLEQVYALWDNGRIDPIGPPGAAPLPILDAPTWYTSTSPPAQALHITSWAVPSGYVLDYNGGAHPFGGALALGTSESPYIVPGVPYTGGIAGVQNNTGPTYVDWSWDPNGTGQFYVLDLYGKIYHAGGATPCPRSGRLWSTPMARRFEMQWSPWKRSLILDMFGGRNQDFPRPYDYGQTDGYYNVNRDWARDLKVTAWGNFAATILPSGYLLVADGRTFVFGPTPPPAPIGFPRFTDQNVQVGLEILSATDPRRFLQVGHLGRRYYWTASTPPVVTAGGSGSPAAVVTDTTRPILGWDYSDPQTDSQAAWQVGVWTQAYVDANVMTNPLLRRDQALDFLEGDDRTRRGVAPAVDLPNGLMRMYARAQDTSGLWSPWSNWGWSQNVPLPITPTALTASTDRFQVGLALTTPSPAAGSLAIFEYADGDGWIPVLGAEAVPLLAVTTATDYGAALGAPRTYRARTFREVPRVTSAPSPEVTVTVEARTFVLTSTADPDLGGEVFPEGSMDWQRDVVAGVFQPLGSDLPVVISGGKPKGRTRALTLDSADRVQWQLISDLVESDSTLLLREPFGEVMYCRVVGSWARDQIRALSAPEAPEPLAHVHSVNIPLTEVARPLPVPTEDA